LVFTSSVLIDAKNNRVKVMSFDQQNLEAFIELLSNKRSLFSSQDRSDLAQLISPIPDDIEKLSEAIASWYQKHPKILDAQLDMINNLYNSNVIYYRVTENINQPEIEINKEKLKKAIQLNVNQ
jgi:adenine-specific DNA methylase